MFQLFHGDQFFDAGNRSTQRKLPTCRMQHVPQKGNAQVCTAKLKILSLQSFQLIWYIFSHWLYKYSELSMFYLHILIAHSTEALLHQVEWFKIRPCIFQQEIVLSFYEQIPTSHVQNRNNLIFISCENNFLALEERIGTPPFFPWKWNGRSLICNVKDLFSTLKWSSTSL